MGCYLGTVTVTLGNRKIEFHHFRSTADPLTCISFETGIYNKNINSILVAELATLTNNIRILRIIAPHLRNIFFNRIQILRV